jgi:hypothetical protein
VVASGAEQSRQGLSGPASGPRLARICTTAARWPLVQVRMIRREVARRPDATKMRDGAQKGHKQVELM